MTITGVNLEQFLYERDLVSKAKVWSELPLFCIFEKALHSRMNYSPKKMSFLDVICFEKNKAFSKNSEKQDPSVNLRLWNENRSRITSDLIIDVNYYKNKGNEQHIERICQWSYQNRDSHGAHLLYMYFENVLMNINVKAKVWSLSVIDKLEKLYSGGWNIIYIKEKFLGKHFIDGY